MNRRKITETDRESLTGIPRSERHFFMRSEPETDDAYAQMVDLSAASLHESHSESASDSSIVSLFFEVSCRQSVDVVAAAGKSSGRKHMFSLRNPPPPN